MQLKASHFQKGVWGGTFALLWVVSGRGAVGLSFGTSVAMWRVGGWEWRDAYHFLQAGSKGLGGATYVLPIPAVAAHGCHPIPQVPFRRGCVVSLLQVRRHRRLIASWQDKTEILSRADLRAFLSPGRPASHEARFLLLAIENEQNHLRMQMKRRRAEMIWRVQGCSSAYG